MNDNLNKNKNKMRKLIKNDFKSTGFSFEDLRITSGDVSNFFKFDSDKKYINELGFISIERLGSADSYRINKKLLFREIPSGFKAKINFSRSHKYSTYKYSHSNVDDFLLLDNPVIHLLYGSCEYGNYPDKNIAVAIAPFLNGYKLFIAEAKIRDESVDGLLIKKFVPQKLEGKLYSFPDVYQYKR